VRAGLQRELDDVGRDLAGFLGVRALGSTAVARRMELTGRVHGAETRAREGGTSLIGRARNAKSGEARTTGEVGTNRSAPPVIEKKGIGACASRLGLTGRKAEQG
jgi:hypothetical protein